jgi:putative ABC transport system permease protein
MTNWKEEIRNRLANLRLDPAREVGIVEELAEHMEDRYQELLLAGVAEEEAARAVLAELNDSQLLARELRLAKNGTPNRPAVLGAGTSGNLFADLRRDLRYALRMLRMNPGFTAVAVIALALGIGANTAIFSVVDSVLLRPLPFNNPDRLMVIREMKLPQFPEFSVSPGNFLEWQKQNTVFDRMIALRGSAFNLMEGGEPERLRGTSVTDGFFSMLGVQPQIGRDFLREEDQPDHNHVVILSYGFWQRRYGGDPGVLNRSINLDGESYNVIGVMPSSFSFGGDLTEFWTPMGFTADQAEQRGGHFLRAIGQLKPGATVQQARAELSTIAARLGQQYPDSNAGWDTNVTPLLESTVRSLKPALLVLLGAVGFILLIACANVANLLLSRAAARQKEIGIRAALGASRWRIVRQMLTESLLLSLFGGAAGVVIAIWGMHGLLSLAPKDLPRITEVSIDSRVLVFTFAITLLTGLGFGLVPALQASKVNLNETLKDAGRGSTEGGRRQIIRSSLVVLEIALALLLLVGAGLMVKSFVRLQNVDPGFDPNNALTLKISLPRTKYPEPDQRSAFYQELIEKVSVLPGVEAVGASVVVPLSGDDYVLGFSIKGRPPYPAGTDPSTNYYSVNADYFKAMGIRLLKGRLFTAHDTKDAPHVAIINETMAKKYFPDEDPIGKFINVTNGDVTYREIVGIVKDVKHYGLDQEPKPQTYEPFLQKPAPNMTLVVRTGSNAPLLTSAIRNAVLSIDKTQPLSDVKTLDQYVAASIAQQRLSTLLLGIFAAVAMALSAVGIYGVMSYSITQRTHEIGIRRALGASRSNILKLVVGYGMLLTLIGVVIGLAGAFALTRLMTALLFGVSATDFTTFAVISASLVVVALVACLVPARRALKVDPMVALRYE